MLGEAFLVALVAAFGQFDYQLGTLYAFRPIVLCPLVGLLLGDLPTGLQVGATLELLFMGQISVGAYVPPDEILGGVLSCAFAISLGEGVDVALALAMPIAVLSLAIGNLIQVVLPLIVDQADKAAVNHNIKGVYATHWVLGMIGVLEKGLLAFFAFYLGVNAVQGLLDWIPSFVLDGFGVAAGILPAMGFAMLARMILNKKVTPFYFIGFLLASYMGVPVLGIALFGIAFLLIYKGISEAQPKHCAMKGADDDDF